MEEKKQLKTIIIILIILLIWAISYKDKYDGLTAEEWFIEYDYADTRYNSFRDCVEDFDSLSMRDQIDYGGVFYYCQ